MTSRMFIGGPLHGKRGPMGSGASYLATTMGTPPCGNMPAKCWPYATHRYEPRSVVIRGQVRHLWRWSMPARWDSGTFVKPRLDSMVWPTPRQRRALGLDMRLMALFEVGELGRALGETGSKDAAP